MLNCLVALTFQIVGATSVLIVYSLRWLLLLKSKDEPENQPSPPLHPGTVHDALLSRPAMPRIGRSINPGAGPRKNTNMSEREAMRRTTEKRSIETKPSIQEKQRP